MNTFGVYTKRQAVAFVRAEANGIIEQLERRAKGWDIGPFRDDDTVRRYTIAETLAFCARAAFDVARDFATKIDQTTENTFTITLHKGIQFHREHVASKGLAMRLHQLLIQDTWTLDNVERD